MLFFKEIGSATDPGEQLRRVLEFRQEVITSKAFFFRELSDDLSRWQDEFRRTFHKLVFTYIEKIDRLANDKIDDTGESTEPSHGNKIQSDSGAFRDKVETLKVILDRLGGAPNDYQVEVVDVARLRLIGAAWHRPGMTEAYLGTHDANVIFRHSGDLELGYSENLGLIDAGLAHLKSQNAPLWRWINEADGGFHYLRASALYASDEIISVGALTAMTRAKIDLGSLKDQFEEIFSSAKPIVRNAMLGYMGALGGEDFVRIALSEFERADYSTLSTATTAIIQAISHKSAVSALQFILERNVALPNGSNQRDLLDAADGLSQDYLRLGLIHRDASLRAFSLNALYNQNALTEEQRRELLNDTSPVVRAAAVSAALAAGETLSVSDCEKIVVRKTKTFGSSQETAQGREEFGSLRAQMLSAASDKQLATEADGLYEPAEVAYALLLSRHWKSRAADARENVRDRFKTHFARVRQHYLSTYGEEAANLIFPVDSDLIFEYRASKMVRAAMDVIAVKGDKSDLPLFRAALSAKYMTLSSQDLAFFARHGRVDDIELLSRTSRSTGGSLLMPKLSVTSDDVARTILRIARSDLNIIFSKDISFEDKKSVLRNAPKSSFVSATEEFLFSALNEKQDELRRLTAIRVAQCLPKKRIRVIDQRYHEQGYHYYNVSHWLDLALSMPGPFVECVTASELRAAG